MRPPLLEVCGCGRVLTAFPRRFSSSVEGRALRVPRSSHRLPRLDTAREAVHRLPISAARWQRLLQWTTTSVRPLPSPSPATPSSTRVLPDDSTSSSTSVPLSSLAALSGLFRRLKRASQQQRHEDVLQLCLGFHQRITALLSSSSPSSSGSPAPGLPADFPLARLLRPLASVTSFALTARTRLQLSHPSSPPPASLLSVHSLLQQFEAFQLRIRQKEGAKAAGSTLASTTVLGPYCAYVAALCRVGEEKPALRLIDHMERERLRRGESQWEGAAVLLHCAFQHMAVERVEAAVRERADAELNGRLRRGTVTAQLLDSCIGRLIAAPSSSMAAVASAVQKVDAVFDDLRLTRSPHTFILLLHPRHHGSSLQADLLARLASPAPLPLFFPLRSSTLFPLLRALGLAGEWDRLFALLHSRPSPPPRRQQKLSSQPSSPESPPALSPLATLQHIGQGLRTARRRERRDGRERGGSAHRDVASVPLTAAQFASLLSLVASSEYHHRSNVPSLSTFLPLYRLMLERWAVGGGQKPWLRFLYQCADWQQQGPLLDDLTAVYCSLHLPLPPDQQRPRRLRRLQMALLSVAAAPAQSHHLERVTRLLFHEGINAPPPSLTHPLPPSPALSLPPAVFHHWLEVHLRTGRWSQLLIALRAMLSSEDGMLVTFVTTQKEGWVHLLKAAVKEEKERGKPQLHDTLRLIWTARKKQPRLTVDELAVLEAMAGEEVKQSVEWMQAMRADGGVDAAIGWIEEQSTSPLQLQSLR